VKRWKWGLLIFELLLIAAILILPQVDLPYFTFHGGTAPVVVKARISPVSSPAVLPAKASVPEVRPQPLSPLEIEHDRFHGGPDLRLSSLCILIV
jgi:hypothetical protein